MSLALADIDQKMLRPLPNERGDGYGPDPTQIVEAARERDESRFDDLLINALADIAQNDPQELHRALSMLVRVAPNTSEGMQAQRWLGQAMNNAAAKF